MLTFVHFRWGWNEEDRMHWALMRVVQCTPGVIALVLLTAALAQAADPPSPAATSKPALPAALTAEQDHQRIMDVLHLASIAPGPNNPGNNDESKANPFPNLPDPLTLKNGQKVTTAQQWWQQRRPEILEDFERDIYGRTPKVTPKVTWEVTRTSNDSTTTTRQLAGHVDNSAYPLISLDIQLTLTTPTKTSGPVPVIMQLAGSTGGPGRGAGPPPGSWQQLALSRGWGYATLGTYSIQADNGAGLTAGIIGLVNKGQPRGLDDWGMLSAWAWGASRALDYFATDPAVDAKQVGIEGHSRWGKATVLAMALDQRFAIAYVSSSGAGGAHINRRNFGETIENLAATKEYYWFAGNFIQFAGHAGDMPVDGHELIALCAPRPVFVGGGRITGSANDAWADPQGMFMAAVGAGPVYKLLGKKDLGTAVFPPIETALIDGDVAFREHSQGHTDAPNWPTFFTFADRYLKGPARPATQPAVNVP
jgi:hypothetical protein